VLGGFGSAVCEIVSEIETPRAVVKRIGFNDCFVEKIGSRDWLLNEYKLSGENIKI
jgi:transketolase C-terminal domain/subunit